MKGNVFSIEIMVGFLLVCGLIFQFGFSGNDIGKLVAVSKVRDLLLVWQYLGADEAEMVWDANYFLGGNYSLFLNGKPVHVSGKETGVVETVFIYGLPREKTITLSAG